MLGFIKNLHANILKHHPHFSGWSHRFRRVCLSSAPVHLVDVCVAVFEFDGEVFIPAVCPAAVKERRNVLYVTSTELFYRTGVLFNEAVCTAPSLGGVGHSAAGRG
ncbi:hypothetical protein KCP70_16825 [Salmonella enterica subsp. enterica]|nr:hypothetical protein KCP70_16825 [Salmonella enterica subsp. enterica]